MTPDNKLASETLASIILLRNGELSIDDIMALPFVEDEEDASLILGILRRRFNCELQQRRVESSAIPAWEQVLRLKSQPKPADIPY